MEEKENKNFQVSTNEILKRNNKKPHYTNNNEK